MEKPWISAEIRRVQRDAAAQRARRERGALAMVAGIVLALFVVVGLIVLGYGRH